MPEQRNKYDEEFRAGVGDALWLGSHDARLHYAAVLVVACVTSGVYAAAMPVCGACAAWNEDEKAFCEECGSPLAASCPSCGAPTTTGKRFCGGCGASLTGASTPRADAATRVAATTPLAPLPVAERRVCSVLFCDLVGFTPLSEARDPEEVRELLSRYFEVARTVVGRYGGVVEKFIGDAVMAVWGCRASDFVAGRLSQS